MRPLQNLKNWHLCDISAVLFSAVLLSVFAAVFLLAVPFEFFESAAFAAQKGF